MLKALRHVAWFAIGALGTVTVLAGAVISVEGLLDAPDVESAERCPPTKTTDCFADSTGMVERRDGSELTVRYDDRRRRADVSLLADEGPAPGTTVVVRFWEEDIVAIFVPATGRRYRTIYWPRRWDPYGLVFVVVGSIIVVLVAARSGGRDDG